jgi:hypothetical protein
VASKLTTIRDALAKGELKRCQRADGFQISLSHQGGTGTTLWARGVGGLNAPEVSVNSPEESGGVEEFEFRAFRIPRQTGFTGTISENDEITVSTTGLYFSSRVYVVDRWDIEGGGAVYVVYAYRKITRRSAV